MAPFHLELELTDKLVTINVEQLDRLADEDGYIRFDVTEGFRRVVIFVNVEDQLTPPETEKDAEALFEAIHYPESLPAFSLDDGFSTDEVPVIAHAIRQHDRKLRLMFNKFMNRSIFPDL